MMRMKYFQKWILKVIVMNTHLVKEAVHILNKCTIEDLQLIIKISLRSMNFLILLKKNFWKNKINWHFA